MCSFNDSNQIVLARNVGFGFVRNLKISVGLTGVKIRALLRFRVFGV